MESISNLEQRTGKLLREARLNRNMPQAELAQRADVAVSTIANLENGRGGNLQSFLRVLRALDRLDLIDQLDEGFAEPTPMERLRMKQNKPQRPMRATKRYV